MKVIHAKSALGLTIVEDMITVEAEDTLLEKINTEMERERTPILRYGWSYNPADTWVQDIPDWLRNPRGVEGDADPKLDSVSVHEYLAGRGIPPHIDSAAFGPEIFVLSLLGDSFLIMEYNGLREVHTIPRRSLYILSGAARELWTHAIEPVKSRRFSIVYRSKL